MPLDTKEENIYFNSEKLKAANKLLSEGINKLITLMLRRAFGEGYRAKERYDESLEK